MLRGMIRVPLDYRADDRGWFAEVERESLLPKRTVQANISFCAAASSWAALP